ncbi:hypothetical protein Tco_0771728 [Tanacetum coccineum]|uniref:Uncharacterized protein n=1 Tax=Tanacetum coccineum TaxID=301880 RepID=A0ABQ4ZIS0_9ASTR
MKLKRLKASTALMTRQTDAEQRRPTIKKLEVKQVEFKLGEDCWEIQVKRSKGQRTAKQKVKVLLSRKSKYCQSKIEIEKLRTQEVLDLEDRRKEKKGKKE